MKRNDNSQLSPGKSDNEKKLTAPRSKQSVVKALLKQHPCADDPMLAQRMQLIMYLRRLYHSLDVLWEKELSQFNLTPAQLISLLTIIANEGLSMSKLADLCLWNRSTASRIARSLYKKDLISITPVDGKTSALHATAQGQNLAARYISKEAGEFKHSLMLIAEEAKNCQDVQQWLKNCVQQLLGEEAVDYVESSSRLLEDST